MGKKDSNTRTIYEHTQRRNTQNLCDNRNNGCADRRHSTQNIQTNGNVKEQINIYITTAETHENHGRMDTTIQGKRAARPDAQMGYSRNNDKADTRKTAHIRRRVRRPLIQCVYCGRPGHKAEECIRWKKDQRARKGIREARERARHIKNRKRRARRRRNRTRRRGKSGPSCY